MRRNRLFYFPRFLAILINLSVIFTQVLPPACDRGIQELDAGNGAASSSRSQALRPATVEGRSTAGLEEALAVSSRPANKVDLSQFDPETALNYLAWETSRSDPRLAAEYYDRFHMRQGKSDCRVCSMRGNVLKGIPRMLHLMLTGGYDGAGIAIKARVKGKYFLILVKDRGHLDALLQGMFSSIEQQLRILVATEYGVDLEQVRPVAEKLEDSFKIDQEFGDEVFQMKVGKETVSIPMEAIGHTRWATQGRPSAANSHPFLKSIPNLSLSDGRPFEVVLAHNGNFISYELFKSLMMRLGAGIDGETDSEVLALVAGFMHRGHPEVPMVVPVQQATERMLRFIKYVEDCGALLNLLEQRTEEANRYHSAALQFLWAELSAWGVETSPGMVDADLIVLAKNQMDHFIETGLTTPWVFDAPEAGGRQDIAKTLSANISSDKKDQTRFRQKFFDPFYSSLAITLMNNAEDGIVVARGRTGGDIEVYAPPLQSVAQRLDHEIPKLESNPLPTDAESARAQWLPHCRDLVQQIDALHSASANGDLWLPPLLRTQLEQLKRRAADLFHRVERLPGNAVLSTEKEKVLGLSRDVQKFAQTNSASHDPGRRIAASEKRAIPGVPGTARVHPEERFRKAGRGEMDVNKVDMGHVVHMAREIRWSSVWDDELKTPLSAITPERGMVDIANVELGGADSRLEREIGNQVAGWGNTLDQFREGTFPDLHYTDVQLGDVGEWTFVAEGTSNHLAQLTAMVSSIIPKGQIHFQVMTGKEFQATISSEQLEMQAKRLATQKKRIMVTFVSNTGQTETLRNGVQQLNVLNQRLTPEEQVLPSVITNVAGSAIDLEVSKFDGDPHAVYTLVGYEAAVPATGSLNVGVIAAGLLATYVQSVQKALPGGRAEFFGRITKFDVATEHMKRIIEQRADGSLIVKPEYREYLENVFGRLEPTAMAPLVWIMGWWIWKIGASEARLKLQEGFRAATVSDWDVISGKHGPYAILRPGTTAIAFLPSSKAFKEGFDMVSQGLSELRSRVDSSEAGGKRGNLIVLMDAEDYAKRDVLRGISDIADVIVPLPDMDDPFTGFMTSALFMQLVTLYGARARFEPVREKLLQMNQQIENSGILHTRLRIETGQSTEVFHNAADLLLAFSATLSDPRTVAESEGRKVLTELTHRDPDHFREFRQEAQRPGRTATEIAADVARRVKDREIGGHLRTPAWDEIRRYADGSYRRIQQIRDRLQARSQALRTVLQEHGIDPEELTHNYQWIDSFSLSPSEAIRFAGDQRGWREYTETYVRHLSKQISGVEARFDAATRELLLSHGISQELLDTTLRGLLRIENGQIRAYPGVLDLVSRVTGKPKAELLRVALHHEGAEFLLRLQEGTDKVLGDALRRQVTPDELAAFRSRFEEMYGEVDEEAWPYEVVAQYYTARFARDTDKLDQTFGIGVGQAIENSAGDLHRLLTIKPLRGESADQAQIRTLQQVAHAIKVRSRGAMDLSVQFNEQVIQEVEAARAQWALEKLEAAIMGGLEENPPQEDRVATLIQEVESQIDLYGRISRSSESVPEDAPFSEQVTDVTVLLRSHRFEEARQLLEQFVTQLRSISAESMSATAIITSLMRVLERALAHVNELLLIAPTVDPVEAQIRSLADAFRQTGRIQFGVVEEPGPPRRALLLLVGGSQMPRTHHALIHDISEAKGINIRHIETRELPSYDVDLVTVDATVRDLDGLGILTDIRDRLQSLYPSQEEIDLNLFLRNNGFENEETRWLTSLYGPYQTAPFPRVRLDVEERAGQTYLAALFPFAGSPQELEALRGVLQKAIGKIMKPIIGPNTIRAVVVPQANPPVALVLMDFNASRDEVAELGILDVVEGVLHLQVFLKGRTSNLEDQGRLMEAFSQLKQKPGGAILTHPAGELTYIVAAIPFQQVPGLPAELNLGILEGVQEFAQQHGIKIRPERLFVAQYQETPQSSPIALVQVVFPHELVADENLNLVGQIQKILQPYTRSERPTNPPAGPATRLEKGEEKSYTIDQAVDEITAQRKAYSTGDRLVETVIFYMGMGTSENVELSILGDWVIGDLVTAVAQRSPTKKDVVIRVADGKMRVLPAAPPQTGLEEGRAYEIYRNAPWPLPVGTILVRKSDNRRYRVSGVDEKDRLTVVDPKTEQYLGTFSKEDLFPNDEKWETSPLYNQISPATIGPQAGLEETAVAESPLDLQLPDWMPPPQAVLRNIQGARKQSFFIQTLTNIRTQLMPPSGYRNLSKDEQKKLESRLVTAEDWGQVTVPKEFGAQDIERMWDVVLLGTVRLGLLRGTTVIERDLQKDKTDREERIPSAIKRTVLENVVVGNDVLIQDNKKIQGYVIEDGAAVYDNGVVSTDKNTKFGLGAAIPVGPETGGRAVKVYPEMLLGDIARLARSRGDKDFQAAYQKEHDRYVALAQSDYGYIGRGAQLSSSPHVRNLFLSPGAEYSAVPDSHNVIVLSGAKDLLDMGLAETDSPELQASERTRVRGAQEIKNAILQQGVSVSSGAIVKGSSDESGAILLEHSRALEHVKIKEAVVAPNTHLGIGEWTASLVGPHVGGHHSSIVIGVDLAEGMGNVGAEAAIGSNHTSRAPDQELRAGEGNFFGLNSSYSFSGNYADAPYAIFGRGVSVLPQRLQMPFPLIERPDTQIHGISPEFMQISPAWVWSDNAYMPMRNERKYVDRDKAKRHDLGMGDLQRYPYEILRPSIVNKMIRARNALNAVKPETARVATIDTADRDAQGKPVTREVRYYTGDQIPGLGKNFMTEEARNKAIRTYSFMIEYYAFKGLLAEVKKRVDAGRIAEVATLLEAPSKDLRWEHERRVLITEVPGITVTSALQTLVERQIELAQRVRESKEKDDKRGERMLDDYGEAHVTAENDGFVKQSAADAQKLQKQVDKLVSQLKLAPDTIESMKGLRLNQVDALFKQFDTKGRPVSTLTVYLDSNTENPVKTGIAPQNDLPALFESAAAGAFPSMTDARAPEARYDVTILNRTDIRPPPAQSLDNGVHLKIVIHNSSLEEGVDLQLLRERKALLPSADSTVPGVGIVAGPHYTGLAYGTALSQVNMLNGPVPVVFVVEDKTEAVALEKLGFTSGSIFQVGSKDYPDLDDAITGAYLWLEVMGVSNAIPLGVEDPVTEEIQQLLRNLFGVELTPESLEVWRTFIRDALLAFQA